MLFVNQLVGFGAGAMNNNAYGVSLDGSTETLSRTPGVAGNRRLAAVSLWLKRTSIGTLQTIFAAGTGGTNIGRTELQINSSNKFVVIGGGGTTYVVTTATLTDTTSYHHVLFHWDNDNGTADNRARIWLDGSELTALDTNNKASIATATDYAFNSTAAHYLGRGGDSAARFLAADVALFYYFDGVALAGLQPSNFYSGGSAVQYSGSYGTNGAHLDFANAADLGNDISGNNNHWTLTNINSSDQVTDGPTKLY